MPAGMSLSVRMWSPDIFHAAAEEAEEDIAAAAVAVIIIAAAVPATAVGAIGTEASVKLAEANVIGVNVKLVKTQVIDINVKTAK